jgi:hypothetical protein
VPDAPDWQLTVSINAAPVGTVPGPDSPDFQFTVQVVPSAQSDAPDWQVVAVGPGGMPLPPPAPPCPLPFSWWRLNETSGTTAADSMGNNDGTYNGGPTLGQPGIIPGSSDKCALFVPNEFMVANAYDGAYPGPYAMGIAFKSAVGAGTTQGIAGLGNQTTPYQTELALLAIPAGNLQGGIDQIGPQWVSKDSAGSVMDGNAHLAVVSWDPASHSFEVWLDNVVLTPSLGVSTLYSVNNLNPVCGFATPGYAGGEVGDYYRWNGWLQSFTVWHQALSAGNLTALWNAFSTGPWPPW